MIKSEVVQRLLVSLDARVELLRPFQSQSLKEITADGTRWNGILHLLQLSVEHVIDIGNHLLAGVHHVVTDDARETIRQMGRAGILPFEFAERIAPMAGFRNVIVHEYLTVDPAMVYDVLQYGLDDFDRFVEYIYDYLRREGFLPAEDQPSKE